MGFGCVGVLGLGFREVCGLWECRRLGCGV